MVYIDGSAVHYESGFFRHDTARVVVSSGQTGTFAPGNLGDCNLDVLRDMDGHPLLGLAPDP
jgi:hypothetical protein